MNQKYKYFSNFLEVLKLFLFIFTKANSNYKNKL